MSSSKKLACKGTMRKVFIRVYRIEILSVIVVFSTQHCELLPSNLLSGSTHPPTPPPPCVKIQTLFGWEAVGDFF